MIQAIIFDCFGVLTTDGWLVFKDRYFSDDEPRREEAIELNQQTDAGLLTHDEFIDGIARLAGIDSREAATVVDSHVRNDPLFEYIRDQLKPRYKIGLLSNASADWTHDLFEAWQADLFDAKTFSFELGVIKPHHAMYETIATKLGMLPEECVFIDDREGFAQGARDVGMQAIWFKDNQQCRQELDGLLGASDAGTA